MQQSASQAFANHSTPENILQMEWDNRNHVLFIHLYCDAFWSQAMWSRAHFYLEFLHLTSIKFINDFKYIHKYYIKWIILNHDKKKCLCVSPVTGPGCTLPLAHYHNPWFSVYFSVQRINKSSTAITLFYSSLVREMWRRWWFQMTLPCPIQ